MKAIYIKWIPATDTKPTRIKASDGDHNSIIIPRNSDLDRKQQGEAAAFALMDKMDWNSDIIGNGDVFVFAIEGISVRSEVTS